MTPQFDLPRSDAILFAHSDSLPQAKLFNDIALYLNIVILDRHLYGTQIAAIAHLLNREGGEFILDLAAALTEHLKNKHE